MGKPLKVVFIGTYVPRKCGIATFTFDLFNAVAEERGSEGLRVVAMNNIPEGYDYPQEVTFEIRQNYLQDYQRAADYINFSDVNVVSLQHEFGIFGGSAGDYVTTLIANIRKPIVTTLHTVIKEPTPEYRESMEELIRYSDKLVVMSRMGGDILKEVYGVPGEKIELIYHGVPDIPFVDSRDYKRQLDVEGKILLLTFGFLGPGKGIEVVLDALPRVVERHPDVVYLVLGATHPEVKKLHGEKYRLSLERRVRDLGLEDNVIFHNRFVSLKELCGYISASDIYISPYLSREQIVSGTLSYAVGMGKAIISTPYWYAKEMLAEGRGILVDFGDRDAMTRAILHLIEHPEECRKMRRRAYEFGRRMTWKEVGRRYIELFERVIGERELYERRKTLATFPHHATLPDIKLDHLRLLTDDVGLFQHAAFGVPDRDYGYSSDDVGRGLVVLVDIYRHDPKIDVLSLITTYMSFLKHAQTENGHYHNFMGYDRRFLDEHGSEDTLGRVIYGLGHVVRGGPTREMRAMAQNMMEKTGHLLENLRCPRAKAYTICGLYAVLKRYPGASRFKRILARLSDELVELYESNRDEGWDWFEDRVTYGNANLCDALLLAYKITGNPRYREVGLATLKFLTDIQWNGKFFDLVGNQGWYVRGGEKAVFGQQPIDAGYLTKAYVTAYEVTDDKQYLDLGRHAFEWFLGRNRLGIPLYDFATGSVADGIDSHGINANRGAESTICFLLALLALSRHSQKKVK